MRTSYLLLVPCLCGLTANAKPHSLPDQTVSSPAGSFRIQKLKCDHALGFLFLKGEIINETNRSWEDLSLDLEFKDKNGPVLPKQRLDAITSVGAPAVSATLTAHNFGPGQIRKINYQETAKADMDSFSVLFKFAHGKFPLQYRLSLTKPEGAAGMTFRDSALSISFSAGGTELDFTLQNNSDSPIKIDWNLVSFVSSWGATQPVVHKGIKLADRLASKAPALIPPGAKLEDLIVPVENIELVSGEWLTHSLLLPGPDGLSSIGSEFQVFMPLEIGGATRNYTFVFKILGAE